jgi:hypothetical protein
MEYCYLRERENLKFLPGCRLCGVVAVILVKGDSQSAADVVLGDNQGAITALQLWQNLIKDGSAILLSSLERGYEIESLLNGKVAM